ncbi:MAG: DUF3237 family protein [Dehalococcoidia bacterium]|nr:DUF3237 family protein [Dehalococcoidia bacterium]
MATDYICEFAMTRTAEYVVAAPDPVFGTTTATAHRTGRVTGRLDGRFTWENDAGSPAGILAESLARGEIVTADGAQVTFRVATMLLPSVHGQEPADVLTVHFQSDDPRYAWLSDRMFMAEGDRHPTGELARLRVHRGYPKP